MTPEQDNPGAADHEGLGGPATVELSPTERREIAEKMATCPFVGTAVANGSLRVLDSAAQPLASIDEVAALGDSGGGNLGTRVLRLFARGNHSRRPSGDGGDPPLVPADTFSLQFGGSQGAHPGHSGILLGDAEQVGQGRLEQEHFERLARHADEDGRLSIDSVGDFIAENLKRDPKAKERVLPILELTRDSLGILRALKDALLRDEEGEKTKAFEAFTRLLGKDVLTGSAGEWALLFAFLRRSPSSDGGDIALEDVRKMFLDKEFPEGWELWEKTAIDWIKATLLLTKDAALAYHFGWE